MNIDETTLDALYELQNSRARDIAETGKNFTLDNTERSFKGILDGNQIKFETGTPARHGAIFEQRGVKYFVVSTEQKAGMLVADVKPITTTVEVLRKDSIASAVPGQGPTTRLTTEQSQLPVFGIKGNEFTTPKHAALLKGRIVKHGGSFYEVVHTAISGPFAVLTVRTYNPAPPTVPGRTPEPPVWVTRPSQYVKSYGY